MNRKTLFLIVITFLFMLPDVLPLTGGTAFADTGKDRDKSVPGTNKDSISGLERIFIRQFRFNGNKVISSAELSGVTSRFENREITFEELQALRQELTLFYVNRGYVTSGVLIPDQPVIDGVITLQVIEGSMNSLTIEGNRYFREAYIRKRLEYAAEPAVNIYKLQESLLRLQQDPRIKRINAELGPGISPGENTMKIKVEESSPYKVNLVFSNNQSPSIGAYRGEIILAHMNLTGNGDILEGNFGLTSGVTDYSAAYSIPITSRDTILRFNVRKSTSTVMEDPFNGLDIESREETFGVALSHPVYRTSSTELRLNLTGELRQDRTSLLGMPYSFSEGSEDGKSNVSVLRFSQEWVNRGQKQVLAVRSSFSAGLDAFGATVNSSSADGQFLSWLGQVQWIRQLNEGGLQIKFRTDLQLSNDSLLPLEKFSVGGMNSVRGFRENRLVRDNGLAGSVEFHVPLFRSSSSENTFQLVPFTDFGWSWNAKGYTPQPRTLSSAGLGFIWTIADRITAQAYWGIPIRKIEKPGNDLQDNGFHFQITGQVF